jgi:hypothetical protein
MKTFFTLTLPVFTAGNTRFLVLISFIFFISKTSQAQCPPNIDFETGTFDNWTCYTGSVSAAGGTNTISLTQATGPIFEQHTMYSAPSTDIDFFGGFPVNCPNGSGNSIDWVIIPVADSLKVFLMNLQYLPAEIITH